MRLLELRWTTSNQEHIARHGIERTEVEEVIASGSYHAVGVRARRYGVIGQTDAGRYLMVIVRRETGGVFFVITARDADPEERRLYQRHRRRR